MTPTDAKDETTRTDDAGFDKWIAAELPRATGYEIDLCRTVWIAALRAAQTENERLARERDEARAQLVEAIADAGEAEAAAAKAREDAERLDWLDTLQHRTIRSGVHQKEWPISTDAHAHHGFWTIYLRTGVGSDIEREGQGTIREAIDAARRA